MNTNADPSTAANAGMVFCRVCGRQIHESAANCPGCGARQLLAGESEKLVLPAFLLCIFFGYLGAHRYYAGKIGTGILMLVTAGGLGVWVLIDLIMILSGSFTDIEGRRLKRWV